MAEVNLTKEREFIRLLALGIRPTHAAKATGYGLGTRYLGAIKRMARRDMARHERSSNEVAA